MSLFKYRLFYILFTCVMLVMALILLSRILGYVHSGAASENTYELGIAQLKNHKPQMEWKEDDLDVRGEITDYLRLELTQAYSDAWGMLNLSIIENKDLGLEGYFTKPKIEVINKLEYDGMVIHRSDLNHNMKLHFISLDNQVISFTDSDVVLETTFNVQGHSVTLKDTSDYKIIMTRNDGRWLVNKLVRN